MNDDIILEHHSDVIVDADNKEEYDYLIQNWDAPIVITTMVQLLNAMFDGKSSSVRRFHSLIDSVIVID